MRGERSYLGQALLITIGGGVVVAVSAVRGISPGDDLLLRWPAWWQGLAWLIAWTGWIGATEVVSIRLGVPSPTRWERQPVGRLVLRTVTIVILAPIAEELVFRGLLLQRMATRLGAAAAVLVTAAAFALLHLRYRAVQTALIFLDGIVLGLALVTSQSLVLTMLMHGLGNLFAVWQRLPAYTKRS
ncbi:MAG: lysostaphin resistance A-like protein [Egibacteraceae bacterium]